MSARATRPSRGEENVTLDSARNVTFHPAPLFYCEEEDQVVLNINAVLFVSSETVDVHVLIVFVAFTAVRNYTHFENE